MAAKPILEVVDLQVEFRLHGHGTIRAVDGLSFSVADGQTVALVGESGSGKSVCAQAILGILPRSASITGGQILFTDPEADGGCVDLAKLPPNDARFRALRGRRISMIFQEPMTSLSPLHTVGNQIIEAVKLHRPVSRPQAAELAAEMLALVGFPDPGKALNTYPFELSGGLRQRAMIAMALVCRPALLMADEPTTALDVTIQAQILQLMKELQRELGMSLLLITHDLGVVANMADHVVVIYHGKLMERGPLHDLFEDPRHPYLRALMNAVPRLGMARGERLTPIREVSTVAARPEAVKAVANHAPLLEVRGVEKSFGLRQSGWRDGAELRIKAVQDVSFEVGRGECLGLVGESGCGKTTLSKIIMRALVADAGEVVFNDEGRRIPVLEVTDEELIALRRKIQLIFQDPFSSLNPRMTVLDIISEPFVIHRLYDRAEREARVKELMRQVGLDPRFLSRYPHSFSGGQRQRIGIARALALNPDFLICDEPVSALDVSVQAQILNLLKDLQEHLGLTYLFISHNLAVVDYMAARIAVMCAGHLVEVAERETLFSDPRHPYTRALLTAVPRTDPSRKLDLDALMAGRVSDPGEWPEPFTIRGDERPGFVEVAERHYVRARASITGGASV